MYIDRRRVVPLAGAFLNSALVAVFLLCIAGTAVAQETTAAIRGKIFGVNGAPVTSADIVVEDLRTGVRRTYSTNSSGVFLATRLPPGGPYRVAVNRTKSVVVDSISLGDIYNLSVNLQTEASMEEVVVVGQSAQFVDVAAGPAATFTLAELENAVAFNRDITDVYAVDPRVNLDVDGFSVNCGGKHPRFNSVTLDGVSQNDRFGLNSNGYSTATGMPFPYDGIQQVAVELAPFDVTYGGFSACNINAVTKSGSNEFEGNAFYEWTSDGIKGDSLEDVSGDFGAPFNEHIYGATLGGPIIKDKLFFFAGYEQRDEPRFLSAGFAGSGNGEERPWLSQSDFDRINGIAQNTYNYDAGGQPANGAQEEKKYMLRMDWSINENHNAALIWNKYDGFQDRSSDGDDNEFEFANHFYTKGAESETYTLKLASQWTDAFSTEIFYSQNTMDDSQVTVGDPTFGDHQISIGGRTGTVYLGADDSRQANNLNTESDFFKLSGQYLAGDHVFTFGYEREELDIFNQFVQHSRGGEYDYFDDSGDNPAFCAALSAQGRFDDPACSLSGIDRFELGRPSRIYYGSGGGTNNADDAAASFSNTLNALYLQDEIFFDDIDLTIVAGLRYEWFESDDSPNFNSTFANANGGLRNDSNIDGLDALMPRLGFTWGASDTLSVRGGIGLYSGGNPNVWLSNAWSNDGLTNVQLQLRNFGGDRSILDGSIPLTGPNPGFDVPQELFDAVAATTADNASDSGLVLIDPNYDQPTELKFAIGATYDLPWGGIVADIDYLHTKLRDSAYYVDLSQAVVGTTTAGQPIYDFVNGEDNFMLTNSRENGSSDLFSIVLNKSFDFGLDLRLGYAYTDAEDVSPMTSSTAGSNFSNVALLDIQNPIAATSNYVVPHRFTFRGSFARNFFGDLETRLTVFGYAADGQPQSYVMNGGDLEGDGFFGRHLLYVPNGPNDPNVVFDANFNADEFFAFVAEEGFEPGFVSRNETHARWSTRFDLRIDQELPTFFEGTSGRLYFKMYNVGNFLDNGWGKQYDAQFFSLEVLDASVNAQGQYVFEEFNDRDITDLLEQRSLWEARVGLEFRF